MSYWTWWCLKSPASPLFTQTFIQVQIKENMKAPCYWPFVQGIHWWLVNSPHKWPVTRKMFSFDDVIMSHATPTVTSHGALNDGNCHLTIPVNRGRCAHDALFHTFIISIFKLTHWGWATHICVGKLTIIGSDNGLLPGWRQAIIWTSAGILLIGPLGTNFSEILIGI